MERLVPAHGICAAEGDDLDRWLNCYRECLTEEDAPPCSEACDGRVIHIE